METLAPALDKRGVLTDESYHLAAAMAHSYAVYLDALDHLKKEGRVIPAASGSLKQSPWCAVEKQAFEMFTRGWKELRLAVDPIEEENKATNALDEFFKAFPDKEQQTPLAARG